MDSPASSPALVDAIERIARLYESELHRRSPFHLARCGGCDGPSFQQPCPHCRFYPMGDAAAQRARTPRLTAEAFRRNVERSAPDGRGNLATWYFASLRDSVAHRPGSDHAARADALAAKGLTLEGLPSPEAVFEAVSVRGESLGRPFPGRDVVALWNVAFEAEAVLAREAEELDRAHRFRSTAAIVTVPRDLRETTRAACAAAVEAAHGDEAAWETALDGLEAAVDGLRRLGTQAGRDAGWIPVGNLATARGTLDGIRERRAEVAAPAP